MSAFVLDSLPAPLPLYFRNEDAVSSLDLFADNATVHDAGRLYRGRASIAGWLNRAEANDHPRYRVLAAEVTADKTVVTVEVSGSFAGSPAHLRQAFTLDHAGQIASLETL